MPGAVSTARRAWPLVLMALGALAELSPEQKDRYKRQAREYADRGRKAIDERRKKR